jgi:hypothetical protein
MSTITNITGLTNPLRRCDKFSFLPYLFNLNSRLDGCHFDIAAKVLQTSVTADFHNQLNGSTGQNSFVQNDLRQECEVIHMY